jgi:hypothetical protein
VLLRGANVTDYKRLSQLLRDKAVCKAVVGDYIIYRKDWLRENIEQEYILQKSAREMAAVKFDIDNFKKFVQNEKDSGE